MYVNYRSFHLFSSIQCCRSGLWDRKTNLSNGIKIKSSGSKMIEMKSSVSIDSWALNQSNSNREIILQIEGLQAQAVKLCKEKDQIANRYRAVVEELAPQNDKGIYVLCILLKNRSDKREAFSAWVMNSSDDTGPFSSMGVTFSFIHVPGQAKPKLHRPKIKPSKGTLEFLCLLRVSTTIFLMTLFNPLHLLYFQRTTGAWPYGKRRKS